MSKHTPGPWLFGLSNRNNEAAIIGDIDSVVCYLPDASTGCTFKPADARLIAAAPDLLSALGLLLSVVDDAIRMGDWKVDGRCDPDSAISYARKTMQKATGD